MPANTNNPIRINDGSILYVITFTKDLDNQTCIHQVLKFDDFTHASHGNVIRFADLPDYIRMRYWRIVD